jgi:hypothetical protein
VLDSRVETHSDSESTSYTSKVRYAYVVNGRRYESGCMRFGMTSGGRKASESFVRQHPPGSQMTVYYDPARPSQALLEPGVSGIDLFSILFLTPFLVIMAGSWVAVAGWVCGGRTAEQRFSRRLDERGAATVVRLPGISPIGSAALTALGTSSLLIFVVGITTGMRPSMPVSSAALALVIGLSLWAERRARAMLRLGRLRLEVNPIRRTLTLPLRKRQDQRETIRFDQVDDVEIKRRVRTSDDSQTVQYAPSLRWTHQSGTPQTTVLGFFDTEDEARAMRDWLLRKVNPAASAVGPTDPAGT